MNKYPNNNLSFKIKKVLIDYLKTQFILVILVILIIWGIMTLIPNLHPLLEVLIVVFSYFALSNLMDLFVSPHLLGKTTKTSPFLIFFSFFVGITFFGIIGALFAVPIALVLKTIWEHYNASH
jgi:predicted PurR-regulated permease PerM